MTDIQIIQGKEGDAERVAKVFKASRFDALPYLPELHTPEEDVNYFKNVVFRENEVFLALVSGDIVGFIAFNKEWINHLYLLPAVQRKGIGRQLLELAKNQTQPLKLWTFQKNVRAQSFYAKHGFIIVKTTDGSENQEKEPDVLLQWKPGPTV
jgi:GNAT superfamily N-acetyltransferase